MNKFSDSKLEIELKYAKRSISSLESENFFIKQRNKINLSLICKASFTNNIFYYICKAYLTLILVYET